MFAEKKTETEHADSVNPSTKSDHPQPVVLSVAAEARVVGRAAPLYETHYTVSWGGKTRLLVCTNPDCAKVASEQERRRPPD
jgi:hypothetical protein